MLNIFCLAVLKNVTQVSGFLPDTKVKKQVLFIYFTQQMYTTLHKLYIAIATNDACLNNSKTKGS